MANTNTNDKPTRIVIRCRIGYAHIWEPASVNGSKPKYSVACMIPKEDKGTLKKVYQAIENAKEIGIGKKWGGKLPAKLKEPFHDGDEEYPDDPNYAGIMYFNATSFDAPQIVDRHKQTITDPLTVYSGCYCNVSVNMYPFSAGGNRGVAAGLGNIQFVADGDRLAGRTSAANDFDDLGDDEGDALSDDAMPDYLK